MLAGRYSWSDIAVLSRTQAGYKTFVSYLQHAHKQLLNSKRKGEMTTAVEAHQQFVFGNDAESNRDGQNDTHYYHRDDNSSKRSRLHRSDSFSPTVQLVQDPAIPENPLSSEFRMVDSLPTRRNLEDLPLLCCQHEYFHLPPSLQKKAEIIIRASVVNPETETQSLNGDDNNPPDAAPNADKTKNGTVATEVAAIHQLTRNNSKTYRSHYRNNDNDCKRNAKSAKDMLPDPKSLLSLTTINQLHFNVRFPPNLSLLLLRMCLCTIDVSSDAGEKQTNALLSLCVGMYAAIKHTHSHGTNITGDYHLIASAATSATVNVSTVSATATSTPTQPAVDNHASNNDNTTARRRRGPAWDAFEDLYTAPTDTTDDNPTYTDSSSPSSNIGNICLAAAAQVAPGDAWGLVSVGAATDAAVLARSRVCGEDVAEMQRYVLDILSPYSYSLSNH